MKHEGCATHLYLLPTPLPNYFFALLTTQESFCVLNNLDSNRGYSNTLIHLPHAHIKKCNIILTYILHTDQHCL